MSQTFTLSFLVALTLACALRFWLARRQIAHVLAHRSAVPAQFAEQISLPAHQKAADYCVTRSRFGLLELGLETLILLGLTLGGGLQLLHSLLSPHLTGLSYGIALIFAVMLFNAIVDLPFTLYRQFVIEARFGFNRMTLKLFFADLGKQTLLGLLIGAPFLLAVLWLMERMGPLWWLYVWSFWCAFNLLILFIYPTWIAPLFNKFSPLDDASLKTRIEKLLERCGFAASGIFVMDGSKRSSHGNAYFTGFGNAKRIVFFDTLLARLQGGEVEAVLAHELGHFKHRHVARRIALTFALSLALLFALGQLMLTDWFFSGLGVNAPGTAMALILFFLVAPTFTFLLTPLMSLSSRRHEYQADRYAATQASADELIRALVKLYDDNAATLTPDPLHSLFYDSHPPAALRIAQLQAHA